MSTLYVAATPIGNLEDASPRLRAVLSGAGAVAAESRTRALRLLQVFDLKKPLLRYREATREADATRILARLAAGEDVVLITDAGTPGISDPGAHLVDQAWSAGFRVVPIPGPSAPAAALSASGFAGRGGGYRFLGFLPRTGKARRTALAAIVRSRVPVVFLEAGNRMAAALADLGALAPDRQVLVARELTKRFESLARGPVCELAAGFGETRGEFTVAVAPAGPKARRAGESVGSKTIDESAYLRSLIDRGLPLKEASRKAAAKLGCSRRDAYQRLLQTAARM